MKKIITTTIHITRGEWDLNSETGWVGGKFAVNNLSTGYHGILKQWLDHQANDAKNCLLVSENKVVKEQFKTHYEHIDFKTLDFYEEMNQEVDLKYNLCEPWENSVTETFDIILCQATFEHLYDPVTAITNLSNILNVNGLLLIHTHVPGMEYHPYPRDYLRFYPDWFVDITKFKKNLTCVELIEVNHHIFSAYKKIGNNNV